MLWNTVWPATCEFRYSLVRLMRDFGAFWSPTMPIWRTRVALTTTSFMSSSTASVPVDWAKAPGDSPAPNKIASDRVPVWNRSNIAPLTLRIGFSGFVRGHVCGPARFMEYTLKTWRYSYNQKLRIAVCAQQPGRCPISGLIAKFAAPLYESCAVPAPGSGGNLCPG